MVKRRNATCDIGRRQRVAGVVLFALRQKSASDFHRYSLIAPVHYAVALAASCILYVLVEAGVDAIRAELAKQAVDWSKGPKVEEPSFKFAYELSVPPGETFKAGTSATLTARVTNTGKQPFHQLKAITDSDNGILSDREFIFGKIAPGETREWKVDIKLPQDMSSRTDMVFFELSDAHTTYNKRESASFPIAIEGKPRPHFGFVYAIEDSNQDGLLQAGEEVKLRIFVHNTGEADSSETLVYLKNMSRDVADLRSGRYKLKTIAAGGHQVVEFSLQVKDKLPETPEIELELDIYDALFREFSQKKFKLSVDTTTGKFEKIDGHIIVSTTGAEVRAGASEKMPAIARVTNNSDQRSCTNWVHRHFRANRDRSLSPRIRYLSRGLRGARCQNFSM